MPLYSEATNPIDPPTETDTGAGDIAVSPTTRKLLVNPATVVATKVITLPLGAPDGSTLFVLFGGAIAYPDPVVATLTIAAAADSTIASALTPTSAISGDTYQYTKFGNNWRRIFN